MIQINSSYKYILIFVFLLSFNNNIFSQEKKVAPTTTSLFNEISLADSALFNAFNIKDMKKFELYFTDDLEWFQDNGGLLNYKTVFENFKKIFGNENKLTRKLVKGTLEVHPIKDYGAIEIGIHQFRHLENGKEEIGTFKFVMIWKKSDKGWQISRVISYDH
jgi:ketosteroid isomerase-like protein